MTKAIPMLVSLHIRAPAAAERVLLRFAGADNLDCESVEVTVTDCGLYIATATGPTLGVGLKGLCQAALTAAAAHRPEGAA